MITGAVRLRELRADNAGNSAIVFALLLPIIVGGLALATDFGMWRMSGQRLQLAADAAAVAAAHETYLTDDVGALQFAAMGMLHENGLDIADATITINTPVASGNHAGKEGVQVSVTQRQSHFFSSLFMGGDVDLTREATALIIEPIEPLCILALDPIQPAALNITGTADVGIPDCAVQSNSIDPNGLDLNGSSTLTSSCAYVSGGVYGEANITLNSCPAVKTGWRRASDPYDDVDAPTGIDLMPCQTPGHGARRSMTMASGRYCADISTNGEIYLEAGGTFIIDGVSVTLRSSNAGLFGENVTLIFVNGGTIDLPNGGLVDLTAKTSEEYSGLIMFADRETQPTTLDVNLIGQANSRLEGALYFPNQTVNYVGGSSSDSGCTHLVARQVNLTGNSSFTNAQCSALGVREILGRSGVLLSAS